MQKNVIILVLLVFSFASAYFSFITGEKSGRKSGVAEGEVLATAVHSYKMIAVLELLKNGSVTSGIARLDYCLDQNILSIANASDDIREPEMTHRFLSRASLYRTKHQRVVYKSPLKDESLASKVDALLAPFTPTPPK